MKVVVIGRNYTSVLGLVRSAGMAGCEVIAVRTVNSGNKKAITGKIPIEGASKYVSQHFFVPQDQEALLDLLVSKCTVPNEKVVLLPADDFVASTIDLNQEKLRDFFVFPNIDNKPREVVRLMDKKLQKELAKKAGLTVTEGWVIDINEGKYEIPEGIKYPVFTKPEISFLGNKRCMKRCSNEDELISVITEVAKERDCPLLVEQYIEIEKEYGILGFSYKGEAVIPGIVDKIAIGHGAHNGVTLIGKYSSLDSYGQLKMDLERFMNFVNFTGLFDIDLYESKGMIYFNELNLRLGAFGYAAIKAGYNLTEMLIKALTVNDYTVDKCDFQGEISCISEKVNLDDFSAGYITWKQYMDNLKTVNYGFLEDVNDIEPYILFQKAIPKIRVRRTIKNILNKK